MTKTIICRSFQSFIDLCDNNLVQDLNVHCTFCLPDRKMMQNLLSDKGGQILTATPFLQDKTSFITP